MTMNEISKAIYNGLCYEEGIFLTGQELKVFKYIKTYGSITPLDAFRDLGITKLATVVSRLKSQHGMKFYQYFEPNRNRFGEKVYYMRYWLDKDRYMKDMEGIE